jgi:hypothetical protein
MLRSRSTQPTVIALSIPDTTTKFSFNRLSVQALLRNVFGLPSSVFGGPSIDYIFEVILRSLSLAKILAARQSPKSIDISLSKAPFKTVLPPQATPTSGLKSP